MIRVVMVVYDTRVCLASGAVYSMLILYEITTNLVGKGQSPVRMRTNPRTETWPRNAVQVHMRTTSSRLIIQNELATKTLSRAPMVREEMYMINAVRSHLNVHSSHHTHITV